MGFIDSYKHLEKLCGEIYGEDGRVKAYIEESSGSENSPFNTPEAGVYTNELTAEKKLSVAKTLAGKWVRSAGFLFH